MFRRLVGLNNLIWRVTRMDSKSFRYLTILFAFLAVFGLSSTAFSQCIVSDGGDTAAVGQLRDCLDNTAMDIQVNVNVTLNGILVIGRDVEIFGNGEPGTGPTVEQGMVPQRLFVILDGITPLNVVIRNLTLTGSFTNVDGGLISNDDNNVTVESSNLIDMASDSSGGAIWSVGANGSLMITDSTISGNSATGSGGGIFNSHELTVNNCLITGNTAQGNGAGIDSAGTLVVNNSTISGNDAEGATSLGGGISAFNSSEINDSTISGNTAVDAGGGILNSGLSMMTITNSTISGNSQTDAGGTGGGGLAQGVLGTTNIENTTITANSAAAGGGGMIVTMNGIINIDNSIVANQTLGGDCAGAGTITSNGGNIESAMSCGFMSAGDLQDTDPMLGPLANNGGPTNTHILLPGSPAIDNAGTCGLPDDQRGEPREVNDCDSGSVEVQKQALTITKDTDPVGLLGFNFTSDIPDAVCTPMLTAGNFPLDDGDSISCTITEGNYNVTEIIPADNSLSISCSSEPADGVTINTTMGTLDFTTMPGDTTVNCTFTNLDTSVFSLDVILAGPGSGTVTGPAGNPNNGGINCPGDCTESYNPGTNVTLTATPAAGSEFQEWSDDCNDNGEVTINGNRTCVATFKLEGGGDVLNPGDPLEFIQNNVPKVDEGGEGTFIVTARNATNSNLTNVDITIEDEILVVVKEGQNSRLEPSAAFLEPNIGSCLILNNSVTCDISTLADDVDVVIDFQAVDVSPGDIDILLTAQADEFGGLVSAIARVIITSSDGCTLASPGTSGGTSMLIFLLIPVLVLTRKLFRRKR